MHRTVHVVVLSGLVLALWFGAWRHSGGQEDMHCQTANVVYTADCNGDGSIDISDAICLLKFLFVAGPDPCFAIEEGLTPVEIRLLKDVLPHLSVIETEPTIPQKTTCDGTFPGNVPGGEVPIEPHKTIRFSGVNVQIVNGLGVTNGYSMDPSSLCMSEVNGLGNLIIGYNEETDPSIVRTGSHNIVGGVGNSYSSFGGLVLGDRNRVTGPLALAIGGSENTASGPVATVAGGQKNTAIHFASSVNGGTNNKAIGPFSAVSGGEENTAGIEDQRSKGDLRFGGRAASVTGGKGNTATHEYSSVSAGEDNKATASRASVTGGVQNSAAGEGSSVSGGCGRNAQQACDWRAGDIFSDQ